MFWRLVTSNPPTLLRPLLTLMLPALDWWAFLFTCFDLWLVLFLLASGVLREGDATGICGQDEATSYEKAVFDAVASLVAADGDDERAIELHFKVCLCCVVCGSFLDCTCYQFLFFFSKKEKIFLSCSCWASFLRICCPCSGVSFWPSTWVDLICLCVLLSRFLAIASDLSLISTQIVVAFADFFKI